MRVPSNAGIRSLGDIPSNAAASNPTDFQTRLSLEGAVDVGGSPMEEQPIGRLEIEPDERF